MLEHTFKQTCKLLTVTRNAYGDYDYSTYTTLSCKFREISSIRRGTFQELNDTDAMLWVGPSAAVVKGSLIEFEGVVYQVERLVKARIIDDPTVQFIKCELKINDIGFS